MHSYGQAVEIGGYVLMWLVPTLVLNIPVIAVCFIARRRLRQPLSAWLVASGFIAVPAWLMWRIQELDRGRNDIPPADYFVPGLTLVALGWIGWFIGRWIGRDFTFSSPTTITR